MKRTMYRSLSYVILLTAVCGFAITPQLRAQAQDIIESPHSFITQVDLKSLGNIAVHTDGRLKSLDSFTREAMQYVSGAHKINGVSSTQLYFDLMLRPEAYFDADVIYVKNKQIRAQIASVLRDSLAANPQDTFPTSDTNVSAEQFEPRLYQFIETGLISPVMLSDFQVQELLSRISQDVLRGAKPVQAIETALAVMNPQSLRASLRVVPPPGDRINDPWLTLDDPPTKVNSDATNQQPRQQLVAQWNSLANAWIARDAQAVNNAAAQLANLLPLVNPSLYPEHTRLSWESWYFKMHHLTWIWIIYGLAIIPLLLSIVFRWPGARWLGLAMFLIAFALHTGALLLRWYISQRWPNSNMFEAVTTSAWFGGCLAIILEILVRHRPMRNLFALGSSVASMTALMAAHFLPLDLNPHINNKMPVLHDVWLYIHTNVVIFSYCLIFIAAVSAALYLLYRIGISLRGYSGVSEYARVGGAGSLIFASTDGSTALNQQRSTFGQVLDGTTMVVMELAFVMLWTGICMGAIWADHSWGRPWGWDPKEVFALNTFIIFLLLIHVRKKVKDKGLWTAILAVIGAAVMLFNWIIINFAITGLHSYA